MIPENFKLLFSPEEIDSATRRVAREVTVWAEEVWRDSHTDLITVPILRGGLFFFADLARKIPLSVEIFPARSWSYELAKNGVQRSEVESELGGVPARGRRVLLVDDICDTARTLSVLTKRLLEAGALEVRSAVLVRRVIPDAPYTPNWVGLEYTGKEWLVGYGMEDLERWRNLPGVYCIERGDTSP